MTQQTKTKPAAADRKKILSALRDLALDPDSKPADRIAAAKLFLDNSPSPPDPDSDSNSLIVSFKNIDPDFLR